MLIPTQRGLSCALSGIGSGAAILSPLDFHGSMCSRSGRLILVCATDDVGDHSRFIHRMEIARKGISRPAWPAVLMTCAPCDIRIAAICDLETGRFEQLLLPCELEDWAEEDREDLLAAAD